MPRKTDDKEAVLAGYLRAEHEAHVVASKARVEFESAMRRYHDARNQRVAYLKETFPVCDGCE